MIDFVGSIWIRMNTRVEWRSRNKGAAINSSYTTTRTTTDCFPIGVSELLLLLLLWGGKRENCYGIDFLCPLYSSRSDWLTVTDWRSIIGSLNIIRSRVGFLFGLINNNNKIVYRNGKVIRSGIQVRFEIELFIDECVMYSEQWFISNNGRKEYSLPFMLKS